MSHTIIIAEAGVNHNGSIQMAKELIDAAKNCGVDYVKFQTTKGPEAVTSKFARMADYQKNNIGFEVSQKEMLSKLLLKKERHIKLLTTFTN